MKIVILFVSLFLTSMFWQVNSQITATGSNLTVIPIPDDNPSGATHFVNINGIPLGSEIINVEIDLAINHTWVGDLKLSLTSPGLQDIQLMVRPGRDDSNNSGNGYSADLISTSVITFKDDSVNPAEEMGIGLSSNDAVCFSDGKCDYLPGSDITTDIFADFINSINTNASDPNGVWEVWMGDFNDQDTGEFFVPELRITYDESLGLEESTINNEAYLYPNPTNNILTVETNQEILNLEIHNILGQKVMHFDAPLVSTQEIDVSSLNAGTYITKITTESGSETLKFIKK